MDGLVVAVIVATVGLTVLRVFAARRVAAREGRFVWLMFPATLIGPLAIAWAAVQLFPDAPVMSATLAASAVGYGALMVRFHVRLSRAVSSAPPGQAMPVTATDVYADHLTTMLGFILLSGLVAMVALLIWAVSQAGR